MKSTSWIDRLVLEVDTALRTILPPPARAMRRPFPGEGLENGRMSSTQTQHAVGLMRVNHSGEVCAQALYQGQALTAKSAPIQAKMREAAEEEVEHLAWCERCLNELGGQVSLLNPLWYAASFMLGAIAGLLGDEVSLGFVAEVEKQVEAHLAAHLQTLPEVDGRSRAVLEQMKTDEAKHAYTAMQAGGIAFPPAVKQLMRWASTCMTKSSYFV